jgi:hypothetical protein
MQLKKGNGVIEMKKANGGNHSIKKDAFLLSSVKPLFDVLIKR